MVGLVDVGDDCTDCDLNTDLGDFKSDKTVKAYWVDVTEQFEWIITFRVSLCCVGSSAINKQLELVKKAVDLRTKMMNRIRKLNIRKEY